MYGSVRVDGMILEKSMADLSGTWLGTYWQEGDPTRFELTLVQGGNTLSGRVLDDNYLGEGTLSGDIVGTRISFTKRYFNQAYSYYSVEYTGLVSEDEQTIQGNWLIKNLFCGTWEAHREDNSLSLELSKMMAGKIPVGALLI